MKYIIYARKSTESEDRQALSIGSQISEMKQIAERENLTVVKIFQESKSAKLPGREVFGEMIEFIKSGKAEAILCWKIDRLSRNPVDEGLVKWMLQNETIKKIKTYDRDYNPEDNVLLASIEFSMANQYIRDLSNNVKRGNRAKLEKGGWPGKAPIGYLNNKAERSIYVDKKRAPFIRKIFELYSTGSYSLKEVTDKMYDLGFRSKAGYKIHKSNIHKILTNPFYCGLMVKLGKFYLGRHELVISKTIFDNAQNVLLGKNHSKKQKHFFPYRGFLRCQSCGCALTASLKKGHQYYYCTNGKGHCEAHKSYMRSEYLEGIVATVFDEVKFDEEIIEIAYEASKEKIRTGQNFQENARQNLARQLEFNRSKQSKLLDSHLSNLITEDVYKSKMAELNNEVIALETQIKKIGGVSSDPFSTLEQTKKVFLEAARAKKEFLSGNSDGKRKVIENLLWNLTIENRELAQVSYKQPYQVLANSPKNLDIYEMCAQ
jgi:DNA invertase Pin-like site-specific DNA recombinase